MNSTTEKTAQIETQLPDNNSDNSNKKSKNCEDETANKTCWNHVAPQQSAPQNSLTKDPNDISFLNEEALLKLYNKLSKRFIKDQERISLYQDDLFYWFCKIVVIQLLFIDIVVLCAIGPLKPYMKIIFDFMQFFVGATFAELLVGLYIIVRYVFNENVFSLLDSISNKFSNKK